MGWQWFVAAASRVGTLAAPPAEAVGPSTVTADGGGSPV